MTPIDDTLQAEIVRAEELATRMGQIVCMPEHLLLVATAPEQPGGALVTRCGLDAGRWRTFLTERLRALPRSALAGRYLDWHPSLRVLVARAAEEVRGGASLAAVFAIYVATHDAALRLGSPGFEPPVFREGMPHFPAAVIPPTASAGLASAAPAESGAASGPSAGEPEHGEWGVDLTAAVGASAHRVIVGRDHELLQLVEVLLRSAKGNPVLVGPPGVGKTAIVELLCQRIVRGEVPGGLRGCRVIEINMTGLVANAQYRGQFEARITALVEWAKQRRENTILFIDELHTIVGAGKAEGSSDAANILKPALARGEIRCIGATTHAEYARYIEKDKALSRRFAPVKVDEPDDDATTSMLYGIAPGLERHHEMEITPEAIHAAVRFSGRYIRDRFNPDKAIDVLDGTVARVRIAREFADAVLLREERALSDARLLARHSCPLAPERRAALERAVDDARAGFDAARVAIEDTRTAFRAYVVARDAGAADTAALYEQYRAHARERGVSLAVDAADVAATITAATGIPVGAVEDRHSAAGVLDLPTQLGRVVIGQEEPVRQVAQALQRQRAGLKRGRRPAGAFLFLGSTGVGKTELAKAVATCLFGADEAILRFDMSEYAAPGDVTRLLGASPAYVGYEEGGALTEAVRRKPFSLVLFDEIEKAHPSVLTILLQLLDEGRLTDGQGTVHDFSNCVVVLTSNIGQDREDLSVDVDDPEARRIAYRQAAARALRPELLNRLDVIVFDRLTRAHAAIIATLELQKLAEHAAREIGLSLAWDPGLVDYVVARGYSPAFGARAVVHAVRTHVENPLATALLEARVAGRPTRAWRASVADGTIRFDGGGG